MIKTLNLKSHSNLVFKYKTKMMLQKQKKLQYDQMYEDYICEGLKKAEKQIRNGAKSYSEEEFSEEMRRRYGISI